MGGKRPFLLEQQRGWLIKRLEEKPDLTLHALLDELGQRGTVVSCDTLRRFLKREEVTFKKTLFAAEQDRPDVARRRLRWRKYQGRIDPKRLVFIDETWAETNMTRTRGWNACGKPLPEPARGRIELTLPDGTVLRVDDDDASSALRTILASLDRRS